MGAGQIRKLTRDLGSSVVDQLVTNVNASRGHTAGGTTGSVANGGGTGNLLLMMVTEPTVIDEINLSSDITISAVAATVIDIETYTAWDAATAVGGGTSRKAMTQFDAAADQIAANAVVKLSEQTANTVTGGIPFLMNAGEFLVLEFTNNEAGAAILLATVEYHTVSERLELGNPTTLPEARHQLKAWVS